jgi:hypothetical protein
VGHEQVVQLPLNGCTFITLATLAPGVALPPGHSTTHQRRWPRTNEYLFDGISVLQPEPGQVAFFPVIDAIQEFACSNSPAAELGGSTAVRQPDHEVWRQRVSRECVRVLPQRG